MPVSVSDPRSNSNDQIAHAAKAIGRSEQRVRVFSAIYFGKKRIKTVAELARATGLSRKRVLEAGKKLAKLDIVVQHKKGGDTAYERDDFYSANRGAILRLAGSPTKLARFPTKYNRNGSSPASITIKLPRQLINVEFVSIDELDSFKKVRSVEAPSRRIALPERQFKDGIQEILGDRGTFKDWGGEQNDFYSSNLRVRKNGKRLRAAFGYKGPGTKGVLTPKKMGKNGDQIQRLFKSAADVFIVQYWGEIDQSVVSQMEEFAKAKSATENRLVLFGLIDGADSDRLALAYPDAFKPKRRSRRRDR